MRYIDKGCKSSTMTRRKQRRYAATLLLAGLLTHSLQPLIASDLQHTKPSEKNIHILIICFLDKSIVSVASVDFQDTNSASGEVNFPVCFHRQHDTLVYQGIPYGTWTDAEVLCSQPVTSASFLTKNAVHFKAHVK